VGPCYGRLGACNGGGVKPGIVGSGPTRVASAIRTTVSDYRMYGYEPPDRTGIWGWIAGAGCLVIILGLGLGLALGVGHDAKRSAPGHSLFLSARRR
jgi:hypothetical protein